MSTFVSENPHFNRVSAYLQAAFQYEAARQWKFLIKSEGESKEKVFDPIEKLQLSNEGLCRFKRVSKQGFSFRSLTYLEARALHRIAVWELFAERIVIRNGTEVSAPDESMHRQKQVILTSIAQRILTAKKKYQVNLTVEEFWKNVIKGSVLKIPGSKIFYMPIVDFFENPFQENQIVVLTQEHETEIAKAKAVGKSIKKAHSAYEDNLRKILHGDPRSFAEKALESAWSIRITTSYRSGMRIPLAYQKYVIVGNELFPV